MLGVEEVEEAVSEDQPRGIEPEKHPRFAEYVSAAVGLESGQWWPLFVNPAGPTKGEEDRSTQVTTDHIDCDSGTGVCKCSLLILFS